MKHQIIKTSDGSSTIYIPEMDEHYHSKYGALTESEHIFIINGFCSITSKQINVFEVGFGTGLNAILTLIESIKNGKEVYYEAVEKYPLPNKEVQQLNYNTIIENKYSQYFTKIHQCGWDEKVMIAPDFTIKKINQDLIKYDSDDFFNIIYFDAFAPDIQPELWTTEIFKKLYNILTNGGILVTYSTKGTVKRNLIKAGFKIEKFPGPPCGKRENLKAIKLNGKSEI